MCNLSWTEYGVKWMCVQGTILMKFIIVGFYYLLVYWKFICLFVYFLFFSILHFVLDSMVKNRKVFTQRLIWEIALGDGWLGDLGRVRNGEALAMWQGEDAIVSFLDFEPETFAFLLKWEIAAVAVAFCRLQSCHGCITYQPGGQRSQYTDGQAYPQLEDTSLLKNKLS